MSKRDIPAAAVQCAAVTGEITETPTWQIARKLRGDTGPVLKQCAAKAVADAAIAKASAASATESTTES